MCLILQTPLHLAALRGNESVVEYLISEYGADPNLRDKNGLTPLELSIKKNQLRSEWAIRTLTSKNCLTLVGKLGVKRLRNSKYVLILII